MTGSRQAPTAATTTAITSLVRAGSLQRQRPAQHVQQLPARRHGQQRLRGEQPGLRQPDHPASAGLHRPVSGGHQQRERGIRPLLRRHHQRGFAERHEPFHTTLYEFIRNTDLNAFGYYKAVSGTGQPFFPKPGFNRNQFGADFGGPIIKNKLFCFLDYEGFRQKLTPTVVLTVPTQNEINGILAVDVQESLQAGYLLQGRDLDSQFAAMRARFAKQILGFFSKLPSQCQIAPGTTGINASTGLASNDCATNAPFTDNADKGDLRVDFQQNDKSSWFLKISDRKETGINYPTLPLPLDGQTNGRIKILDQQVALGYTHLMGANKVLDARLGLSEPGPASTRSPSATTPSPFPACPPTRTVAGGLPSTSISGGFTAFGRQSTNPQWQNPSLLDPKVNFTWVKGSIPSSSATSTSTSGWQCRTPTRSTVPSPTARVTAPARQRLDGLHNPAVADTYWADFLFGTTSSLRAGHLFQGPPAADHGQRLRPGRLEGEHQVDPESWPSLGVRLALLRRPTTTSPTSTRPPSRADHHARSRGIGSSSPRTAAAASTARRWSIRRSATTLRASALPMR